MIRLAIFMLPSVLAADGANDQARAPGFIDITRASGIEALLEDHYAAHPRWWLSGLHLVDLDGDGRLDLFFSAHGSEGPALAALGDGGGRFRLAPGAIPTSEIHLAYDFDEDGKVDLTMTFEDGGGRWWRNLSRPGLLEFQPTDIMRGTNTARRQAMIDIDRDGRADWLRGSGAGIHFDLADGKGGFAAAGEPSLKFGPPGQSERLCLPVDLDGDGLIDLVTEWGHYAEPEGHSRIFRGGRDRTFTDVTVEAGIPLSGTSIKGAGDLDGDGAVDLICLAGGHVEIYRNDGRGHFEKKPGAVRGDPGRVAAGSWGLAVVTDLDNDGIPDVLIDGRNFLKVLRGAGGALLVHANTDWGIRDLAAASVDDGLCFGDIDGDSRLDIVGYRDIGNQKRVAVYHNQLPPRHWLDVRPVGLAGNRGAAGAKIRLHEPASGRLLGYEQVVINDSQAAASCFSFARTERHFGLGDRTAVDVSVEFYPSGATVHRRGVRADQTIAIAEEEAAPLNVIFDTDLDGDSDDVAAVAILHALADAGQVRILAMGVVSRCPYSPACLDAINTYYGRGDIPIGVYKGSALAEVGSPYAKVVAERCPNDVGLSDQVPGVLPLYRRILAGQPDGAVTMIAVGPMNNLVDLLATPPDGISGLPGRELVRRKVAALFVMAPYFNERNEFQRAYNFVSSPKAALALVDDWPTRIKFGEGNLGHRHFIGRRLGETPAGNPVRIAFEAYFAAEKQRSGTTEQKRHSADPTTVLYAVCGAQYFGEVGPGACEVREDGFTRWNAGRDRQHFYNTQKMPIAELEQVMEDLLVKPRRRP
jgi:VCBS repeat protein